MVRISLKRIALVLALGLLACTDTPTLGTTEQASSFRERGFYFLAPLDPTAAPIGAFDATLSPEVTVTINPEQRYEDVLASYSMTTGPNDTIHVEPSAERYVVKFPVDIQGYRHTGVYRVSVALWTAWDGYREVGFVDLYVTDTGVFHPDTGAMIPMNGDGTIDIAFFLGSCATITCSGGTTCSPSVCDEQTAACVDEPVDDGQVCDTADHGGMTCAQGDCTSLYCFYSWGSCDGTDANGCETTLTTVDHCGACGTACTQAPQNGHPTCSNMSCGFACNPGYVLDANRSGCMPEAPRQLAPLSGGQTTSRTPALRWLPIKNTTSVVVKLCSDRALKNNCTSAEVSTASWRPSVLTPGVYFWQIFAKANGVRLTADSPIWSFAVGANTPVDTSNPRPLDVNADGYGDFAISASNVHSGYDYGVSYLYLGSPSGLAATPIQKSLPPGMRDEIANAGDVNGDGYVDTVAANPSYRRVHLLHGGPSPWQTTSTVWGQRDYFGQYQLAAAGDVNGDGFGDVIIDGELYAGSAAGISQTPLQRFDGPYDTMISPAGDVNGDGYADVVDSHSTWSVQGSACYTLGVRLGGPGGFTTWVELPRPPSYADATGCANHYASVAAGDIDGDGYTDIVVGDASAGAAYAWRGNAAASFSSYTTITSTLSYLGWQTAHLGDLNNDGKADFAIADSQGHVEIYLAKLKFGLQSTAMLTRPVGYNGVFGETVAGLGDTNGDGCADLVVGAPTHAYSLYGSVHIFRGGCNGAKFTVPRSLIGPSDTYGRFGSYLGGIP